MGHTLTNVLVHVVFSTKNREKSLTAAVRKRLHAYIARVVNEEGGTANTVNGGLKHVHILMRLPATVTLAYLMRRIKGHSSRWLRSGPIPGFAWQQGYSAFSVSYSRYDAVYAYIESQEDHHRRRTFEDELVSPPKSPRAGVRRTLPLVLSPEGTWQETAPDTIRGRRGGPT